MVQSNEIPADTLTRATGWAQAFANTSQVGSNLPQRLAIFTTVGADKVSGFSDYNVPFTANTIKDVLDKVGVCEAFQAISLMKPSNGGGVRTIPVDVFPIEVTTGTAAAGDITPSGTATANATHYVLFNGRKNINGRTAGFTVETSDTLTELIPKMVTAINGALYAPVTAADGTTTVTATVRWEGVTGDEITLSVDTGDNAAGITYAFTQPTGGAGSISLSTALANFGDVWYTKVLNPYGSSEFDTFSDFNGIPDPVTGGTGRWNSLVAKPFICYTGSSESTISTLKAIMASRKLDLTNRLSPAPLCPDPSWVVAASWMVVNAVVANDSPHLTSDAKPLVGLIAPPDGVIGDMNNILVRDDLIKNGCSTVTYNASSGYVIQDDITFRRPDEQNPADVDWRFVRSIDLDMNVIFSYKIVEINNLLDKTIANDTDTTAATGVIKPKDWTAAVFQMFADLVNRALITDTAYSEENFQTGISGTNPNRFDTIFYYKRTGTVRQSATTAYAGSNFGN